MICWNAICWLPAENSTTLFTLCMGGLINVYSRAHELNIRAVYPQHWWMHRIFLENFFLYKTCNLLCYKKHVTEKRTCVKTLLIGSMPSLLTVFLSPLLYQLHTVSWANTYNESFFTLRSWRVILYLYNESPRNQNKCSSVM